MVRNTTAELPRRGVRHFAAAIMTSAGIAAIACGRSNVLYTGDAYGSGQIGSGGSGAVHGGGSGGIGKGGSVGVGGAGGTLSAGGSVGFGGSIAAGGTSGGSGGMGPTAGTGGGPYACPGVEATCDAFHDFPLDSSTVTWGNGAFTGGISVFGDISRDMDATGIHVTGTVQSLASGFNLWFTRCSDLSAYTGVLMTLSGKAMPNGYVTFQLLTNSTFPWQFRPQDGKGSCTALDPSNPFGSCYPPSVDVFVTGFPVAMTWSAISGGMPVGWDAMTSPEEIVGLQWLFPFDGTPYEVDLRLDDLYLLSSEAPIDCVSSTGGMGGSGGIGGMSGAGGIGGMAGSGGLAGTAGGPEAGAGNEAGMSGEGGAPGTAGAPEGGFGGI